MSLTKLQKIIVVLSAAWAIISLLTAGSIAENNYDKKFEVATFMWICFFMSAPVWLYWSGVWVWGSGYILKAMKCFGSLFGRLCAKFFESKISAAVIGTIFVICVGYSLYLASDDWGGIAIHPESTKLSEPFVASDVRKTASSSQPAKQQRPIFIETPDGKIIYFNDLSKDQATSVMKNLYPSKSSVSSQIPQSASAPMGEHPP